MGISEFWIIDPSRAVVLVLMLVNGIYESVAFRGDDRIVSPTFPNFSLTTAQVLSRKKG